MKEVPHRPAQAERVLQWFKTSLRLPDYSTKIPIVLYQRRENGVIEEEQYQINNPTKTYSIPLQVLNSQKGRQ